jgi:MFS family permease
VSSDQPVTGRTAELFAPGRRGLSVGIIASITLVAAESLAIGTVLPIVARELGDLHLYGWVYSAFYLGHLVGIVIVGGALDRMPLRRPFAIGLGLFGIGLLAGGLAPSMPILIAARFIQGLGGGALAPTAYVVIGRRLPDRLQPPMFALMSAAWVAPGIIGPSIAAFVGAVTSWRWVFLGLLPLLALAAIPALRALGGHDAPAEASESEKARATVRRLPNALLAAAGAGLLIAALTSPDVLALGAGSIAGVVLLLPAFRRLTPAGTLRLAEGVPAAVLLRGIMTFSFFAADAYVALLLQTWRGTSPVLTGILFTATTVAWSAGSWWQAKRIEAWGQRRFVQLGFLCIVLGSALTMPVASPAVPPWVAVVTWMLPGIGMGLMYSAVTLVVLRRSPPGEQGAASSALQLADILGTVLGTGVGGAITAAGIRAGGDGLGWALGAVFALSSLLAAVGVVTSRRLPGPEHREIAAPAAAGDPQALR